MHLKEELAQMQRKRIQRVVCSGGGAKGAVYPGSYKAMIDTGLIDGVESFSGASAGSIIAAFMACNMPANILREQLLATNFYQLKGKRAWQLFEKNPPGITILTKDAKPLEEFIRENIIKTLKAALDKLDNLEQLCKQDPKLNDLVMKIKGANPCITFGDLALLNHYFPKDFKQLVLPAVRFPSGEVQIFNSSLTPKVEIALACRASASIPVLFAPVEIEIDGQKQKFIDGGVYDNLPTDYFDLDEQGRFTKNKKPHQTLVFAFGEGLDNKKNQVFQALYGEQWDQVITEETLSDILLRAFELSKKMIDPDEGLESKEEEADLLVHALKLIIAQYVKEQHITEVEAKVIMSAMKKSINSLLLNQKDNQSFWTAYNQTLDEAERINLLAGVVKDKMKPVLYDAGVFERLKRDVLIEVLGDLQAPYKNTQQKELGYQKLRSEYGLRTVELRVGKIKTNHFEEASRVARVMDSLGYLDTINHISNHELHNPSHFNPEQFYIDLVIKFEAIHHATLLGAGKDPNNNSLSKAINSLRVQMQNEGKSEAVISRQLYQIIKDHVERHIDGVEAFALSRAVEFYNNLLSAEELFKETYEQGFKRSGFFSVSNITGEQIFGSQSLHESLKDKNMFELYKNQAPHQQKTRTDMVFEALSRLDDFRKPASQEQVEHQSGVTLSS